MDRTVATGAGVAFVGHIALIALLIWLARLEPPEVTPPPEIEVSFEQDVGIVSSAPEAPQTAAPAEGEEAPVPEQAAGAEAAVPEEVPEPVVETVPTPSVSRDRPEQPRRDARSNQPSTRREVTPPPRPQPPRPTPPQTRPTPPRPTPPRTTQTRQPPRPGPATGQGQGQRSTGSRLPSLGSFGRDSSAPAREARPAAQMTGQAAADIGSAIQRQVQPCARRQGLPASEAASIVTTIRLQLNRDGSLAATPQAMSQTGVDDDNRRYADAVRERAVLAFRQCSPLRNLPQELYDVPRGWRVFQLRFRFPG